MLRPMLALLLCALCSHTRLIAVDPLEDGRLRLDELLQYAQTMRSNYSVVCKQVKVTKSTVTDATNFKESLFRKVNEYRGGKAIMRFDCQSSDQGPQRLYESSLTLPNKLLWGFDLKPEMEILVASAKSPAQVNQLSKTDPFTICLNVLGYEAGAESTEAKWQDSHIYEAAYTKDGRLKCRKIHKLGLAIAEFVFAKDSPLIEEQRIFMNPDLSKPANYLDVSVDEVKSWPEVGYSQTSWRRLSDEKFVPHTFFATQNLSLNGNKYPEIWEVELRFEGWKFGDAIDTKLLDEATFTKGEIPNHIDFFELEQLFAPPPKTKR